MTLLEKQQVFARLAARLILRANEIGYEVTLGEAWRPQVTADYYASKGTGSKTSNHLNRLAIDINLYVNGVWLKNTEHHEPLGKWWEGQSSELWTCMWGGRWGDGNHYSFEHKGVK